MSIVKTITNDHEFAEWIKEMKKQGSSYGNSFSFAGADAVQAYVEEYSVDSGENVEWDPIAWCVEYSEYKDFDAFQSETGYTQDSVEHKGYENIKDLDELNDNTTVIEFDGGIIVKSF